MADSGDSPLSTTANILSIITFVYAVAAGAITYLYLLRTFRKSDTDVEHFYEAFSACAMESDLVRRDILSTRAMIDSATGPFADPTRQTPEKDMLRDTYQAMDPDTLGRLFDQVRSVEITLQKTAAHIIESRPTGDEPFFGRMIGRSRWVNRSRELKASLAKREALTARLLVIQMSLFSARMREQGAMVEDLKRRMEELESLQAR